MKEPTEFDKWCAHKDCPNIGSAQEGICVICRKERIDELKAMAVQSEEHRQGD